MNTLNKENLAELLLARILNQGGNEEDLLQIEPLLNEMAARAALNGINSRSEIKVYRLKPEAKLSEMSGEYYRNDSDFLSWNHPASIDEQFPMHNLQNDAYCEVRPIVIGTQESMIAQMETMNRIPAEANYLLSFAREKDIEELWEGMRNSIITTIDEKNKYDFSRNEMLSIEKLPIQRTNKKRPQLTFLESGQLQKHYEGEEVLMLVRFKDLIPL